MIKLEAAIRLSANAAANEAFMKEYKAATTPEFGMRVWHDLVGFKLSEWNGHIQLDHVISLAKKGTGNASAALKWLCDLADKHKVTIELEVEPIKKAGAEGKPLTKAQLKQWYKKNGFKPTGGDYMVREPK